MKYIITFLGATLASTVFMFNLASAGEAPAFEFVDRNQNGMINTEEAAQVPELASIFAGADLDQDGKLNPDEYERAKRHIDSKAGEEAAE
jgi:hypothetical protein